MVRIVKPPSRAGNPLMGGWQPQPLAQTVSQQYDQMLALRRQSEAAYRQRNDFLYPVSDIASVRQNQSGSISAPLSYDVGLMPSLHDLYGQPRRKSVPTVLPTAQFGAQPNQGYNDILTQSSKTKEAIYREELLRQIEEKRQRQRDELLLEQQENERIRNEAQFYDPYGKGGGGAPMRDQSGRLVTDRRELGRSWYTPTETNWHPDPLGNRTRSWDSNNRTANNGTNPIRRQKSFDEEYREQLRKQIEERAKEREREKQMEQELERKERIKFERYLEQQRKQEEEEKRKQKEKMEAIRRRAEERSLVQERQFKQPQNVQRKQSKVAADDVGLEWWEKRPPLSEMTAQPIRNGPMKSNSAHRRLQSKTTTPFDERRQTTENSRRNSLLSESLNSSLDSTKSDEMSQTYERRRYLPRPAAIRNELAMRQLSATREQLQKEQNRVNSALERNDYGLPVFENNENDSQTRLFRDFVKTTTVGGGAGRTGFATGRRPSSASLASALRRLRQTSETIPVPDSALAEESPLVKLIRNSRTRLGSIE